MLKVVKQPQAWPILCADQSPPNFMDLLRCHEVSQFLLQLMAGPVGVLRILQPCRCNQ